MSMIVNKTMIQATGLRAGDRMCAPWPEREVTGSVRTAVWDTYSAGERYPRGVAVAGVEVWFTDGSREVYPADQELPVVRASVPDTADIVPGGRYFSRYTYAKGIGTAVEVGPDTVVIMRDEDHESWAVEPGDLVPLVDTRP